MVIWLVTAATGPQAYGVVEVAIASWIGQIVLFGITFAFFLHLCGGIRHLVWDTVHGFELRSIYISGWAVVAASIALTAAVWVVRFLIRVAPWTGETCARRWLVRLGSDRLGKVSDLVGGARFSGRPRPADAVVRGLNHCAYRQRLRHLHCLAEDTLVATLMILLLIALFHHTALGLQVVIEDYIHSGVKFAAVIGCVLAALRLRPRVSWLRSVSPSAVERNGARA